MIDGLDAGKILFLCCFFSDFVLRLTWENRGSTTEEKGTKITEVPMELHPHSRIKIRKHERMAFLSSQ